MNHHSLSDASEFYTQLKYLHYKQQAQCDFSSSQCNKTHSRWVHNVVIVPSETLPDLPESKSVWRMSRGAENPHEAKDTNHQISSYSFSPYTVTNSQRHFIDRTCWIFLKIMFCGLYYNILFILDFKIHPSLHVSATIQLITNIYKVTSQGQSG